MTKTLQRCTHDNNRRRSQFWLLYLTLEFKNAHVNTDTQTLPRIVYAHTHMHWMYLSRCVGVSDGNGDGKTLLTIIFSKHFQFCILSFLHSHFFRCVRLWFFLLALLVHTHSHHCYHQRKNSSLWLWVRSTRISWSQNCQQQHQRSSDLSSGIFSLHFPIQIQKLFSFLSLFFHQLFICTESDVIILRVVIVKTISFNCNAFETNRFWWSFYFIYIFVWKLEQIFKYAQMGSGMKMVCAKALHAWMALWIFIVIILELRCSFTVIAVFHFAKKKKMCSSSDECTHRTYSFRINVCVLLQSFTFF